MTRVASLNEVAARHYRAQQTLARRTAERVQTAWARIDVHELRSSWDALVGPAVLRSVLIGQYAAAGQAQDYVTAAVAAQDTTPAPAGRLDPRAFTGVASDGRPLESLLELPLIGVFHDLAGGRRVEESMLSGLASLTRIVASQVTDAGRVAAGAAVTNDRTCLGYVRQLNPPSCSRCVVLAGALYRWNTGFPRHPRCDCVHVPTTRAEWDRHETSVHDDPRRYFASLSPAEQDKVFTAAGAQAIRDGADLGQVVNARRGMATAQVFNRQVATTTEATTTRGLAGARLGARQTGRKAAGDRYRRARPPRLMPESIYELADDRAHALELLRKYGYIL